MLEFRDVWYSYGSSPLLQSLNLRLEPGGINTLLGPNGCGKSTALYLASRLLRPQRGAVLYRGRNLWELSRRECARHIGHLRQDGRYREQRAMDVVLAGRYPHRSPGRAYTGEDREIAQEAFAQVGAPALAEKRMDRLSGGERQRVFLAALLAQQAELLLLDEPTTYLDIRASQELMEQLLALRDMGRTILLVTHALDLALRYSDQILLLKEGRLVQAGPVNAVVESGQLQEVFEIDLHAQLWENRQYFFIGRKGEFSPLPASGAIPNTAHQTR